MEQRAELETNMGGRFWPDIKAFFCFRMLENINVPHSLKLYRMGDYFLSKMTLYDAVEENGTGKLPIFNKSLFLNTIYSPNISSVGFQKTLSKRPGGFHILEDKSTRRVRERVQSALMTPGKNTLILYGRDAFQKVNLPQNVALFQQRINSLRVNQATKKASNYNNSIAYLYQKKEGMSPSFCKNKILNFI